MKKKKKMIKLNPKFQKEIFQRVVKKYKDSIKASLILSIPASSIRAYKNLYFKSINQPLLDRLVKIKITCVKEIKENTLSIFNKEDQIKESLDKGREMRKIYFSDLKSRIPKIHEIISSNQIHVSQWFKQYVALLNIPFRKFKFEEDDKSIITNYSNFARTEFRDFYTTIPKKFILSQRFIYFFGLWCGDRTGGKRFGICNKNQELINFTEEFLREHNQKVEKILYISRGAVEPSIDYDKKFVIDNNVKGWVLSVHSTNGILSSFFYYLYKNLKEFLDLIQNKEAFFAGLFDAEGNVSLYNRSFRWACKNKKLVEIYSTFLKGMGLYDRYDGGCLISYNIKGFHNKILPFLRHPDKINKTEFLFSGNGVLPREHREVLNYIKESPKESAREIAKALKKTKVYSELRLLNKFGFISCEGYPYKFEVTPKGLESLGG